MNELMSIETAIRDEISKSKTSWIRLGELLDQARKQHGEDDKAFGRWCEQREFELNRSTLLKYRTAWKEYSTAEHVPQETLNDYLTWSKIASLNQVQKPKVLAFIAEVAAKGEKVTRKDILEWINQTRTKGLAPPPPPLTKEELEKEIRRAKAEKAMAEKTQGYYETLVREMQKLLDGEDYKLVRSCLHPDREAEPERKQRAFTVWQKLHDTVTECYRKVFK